MSSTSPTIVVPLYQYPIHTDTWKPLRDAISGHPHVNFVVIINPNSGPGVDPDGWLPDWRYTKQIPRLKQFSNVRLVGYIRLDYCRRSIEELKQDVDKYANWAGADLAMEGFFFDEVPNIFTSDAATCLETLGRYAKEADGIVGDRIIIHNPGTVPDVEWSDHWAGKAESDECSSDLSTTGAPDIVVTFEESFGTWQQEAVQQRLTKLLRHESSHCCHIVHSVPSNDIQGLVFELKNRGDYMFVTDMTEKFYEAFGSNWTEFVDAVANSGNENSSRQ